MRRNDLYLAFLFTLGWLAVGCEPASVTEARNQLRRGGERITTLSIPIAQDTFTVGEFLPKTDTTTTNGLLGIKFDPESVSVDVGNNLQFSGLSFDAFSFSFNQMLQTTQQTATIAFPAPPVPSGVAPSASYPVVVPPPIVFNTPAGSKVDSATIASGYIVRVINNGTNCGGDVTISLTDANGDVITTFGTVTVLPGAQVIDSISGGSPAITVKGSAQVNGSFTPSGICIPAGSVSVDVTFRPLTLSAVYLSNVSESFNQTYSPLQTDMQSIDSVLVNSGSFSLSLQNRLPIADTLTVQLNGVTKAGAVVTGTLAVPAAAGDGSYTSGTLTFDLTGARIIPPSVVAQVTGTAKATKATITPTVATNAALVNGTGSLVIQTVWGPIDPAKLPKLSASLENTREMPSGSIDFGDLKDAVQSSTLNSATATLTVVNTAQTPVILTGFTLGAVQLNASGQPLRDGAGNLIYEKDAAGNAIKVAVVNPGQPTFTVARAATSSLALAAAPLLDRIAHLLIANTRVAIVTSGTAAVGDGSQSSITRTDFVKVRFQLVVGLDLTIPTAGVVFRRNQAADGLDLATSDADQLSTRLVQATAGARVTNGTPFGVTVNLALVKDSVGSGVDIFGLPACTASPTAGCRVSLDPDSVVLLPSPVLANGQVDTTKAPATGSVSMSISGTNARVLFGKKFTAGVRIRLRPNTSGPSCPTGAARCPGAIRPSDRVIVNAKASVDVKSGGNE